MIAIFQAKSRSIGIRDTCPVFYLVSDRYQNLQYGPPRVYEQIWVWRPNGVKHVTRRKPQFCWKEESERYIVEMLTREVPFPLWMIHFSSVTPKRLHPSGANNNSDEPRRRPLSHFMSEYKESYDSFRWMRQTWIIDSTLMGGMGGQTVIRH